MGVHQGVRGDEVALDDRHAPPGWQARTPWMVDTHPLDGRHAPSYLMVETPRWGVCRTTS